MIDKIFKWKYYTFGENSGHIYRHRKYLWVNHIQGNWRGRWENNLGSCGAFGSLQDLKDSYVWVEDFSLCEISEDKALELISKLEELHDIKRMI
jgi:hypothetical protein